MLVQSLMRVRATAVVLLAVALDRPLVAQRPGVPTTRPTYALSGRIVAATSRQPLTRVRVAVVSESTDADAVLTDDQGRFLVMLQAQASATLAISKAGYAARRVQIPVEKVAGGALGTYTLDVGAAISGRVVDAAGATAVGATITVRPVDHADNDHGVPLWTAQTDDLGEYRVGGLSPGRYTVAAGPNPKPSKLPFVEVRRAEHLSSLNLVLVRSTSARPDTRRSTTYGGRSVVQGRVINDSGEPLAGAVVQLRRPGDPVHQATAGADGTFAISGVTAGSFKLRGARAGYVTLEYGQQRATETGRTVRIRDDETIRGVTLTLPRGNAIVGHVVDEHGEPIEGATVRALQLRYVAGRTLALPVPGAQERRTDDRGHFRVYGLLPGSYLVSASLETAISPSTGSRRRGYAPVFFPATTDVGEAWRISVELRRDAFDTHIVLVPSPAVRVSGFAFDSKNLPLKGMAILAASPRSGTAALAPRVVVIAGDGSFAFDNVSPGQYVVQALGDDDESPEFVSRVITFGEVDTLPIILATSTGATLEGRAVVEGRIGGHSRNAALLPFPTDFERAPIIGGGATIEIDAQGWFKKSGLTGPRRFTLSGAPTGWFLKSVVIRGKDVTDVPFDFGMHHGWYEARVVIGTRGAAILGKVTGEHAKAVGDYTVVVFPTDRAKWFSHSRFVKFGRPSQDDTVFVEGLPPAEYYVATVDVLDATDGAGEWQDPKFLESLASGAERVALNEGDTVDLALKLTRR